MFRPLRRLLFLAVAVASIAHGRAQTFPINAPAPQEFGNFGYAVAALDSNRVVIGAYQIDDGTNSAAGRAYLFALGASNATLLATLPNPAPSPGAYFGSAVAGLTGSRVLVGAPETERAGFTNTGEAFLLATNGTVLRTYPNPAPQEYAYFGDAVAGLASGLVLVGADGADEGATLSVGRAYLFHTNGALLRTFNCPLVQENAYFGYSLAPLDAGRVFIGAYGMTRGAFTGTGEAYLFHTNGTLLQTFTNPFPANNAAFGYALAPVGADRVVVGAYGVARAGLTTVGEAYLFRTNGALLAVLTNPVPVTDAAFGGSVAVVDGDKIIVGADGADRPGASETGEAYLFSTNGTWLATFANPSGAGFDRFGWAVEALDTNRFVVTAPQFTPATNAVRAGGAYVLTLPPLPGTNVTLSLTAGGALSWQSIPRRVLQETTNLTPPVVWTDSALTVTTNGVTNSTTVPAASGPALRAFRLRLP